MPKYLNKAQIYQMLKTNQLKLTKRQSQDGGFLAFINRCPWIIGRPNTRELIW